MTINESAWLNPRRLGGGLAESVLAVAGGLGFTAALIVLLAHFENGRTEPLPPTIGEARLAAMPPEPPPPKPTEYQPPVETAPMPFAGIDPGPADGAVKISPTPPELAALNAVSTMPPAATLDPRAIYSELRPPSQLDAKFERVYDRSEVDQPPHVISREEPRVPASVRQTASQLRAILIVTVGKRGEVTSARVLNSSGNPEFDDLIVANVRDTWVFGAAIKNGRPVACLVQQPVTVRWSSGSHFSTQ